MPGKAFHKTCIAVGAIVLETYIGVDHIGKDFGFRKDRFRLNFFDVHALIISSAVTG